MKGVTRGAVVCATESGKPRAVRMAAAARRKAAYKNIQNAVRVLSLHPGQENERAVAAAVAMGRKCLTEKEIKSALAG